MKTRISTRRKCIIPMLFALIVSQSIHLNANAQIGSRKTAVKPDSLTYIGHSSVKIKTAQDQVIYIDPYQAGNYADSADVLLVTHSHGDHNNQSLVKKKKTCTVITNAEALQNGVYKSFTIGNTTVEAVQVAASIKAAYVIPIHTMPPPDTYSDAIVSRFTAANKLVVKNGQSIALQAATSVGSLPISPAGFELGQNYPNPFNPQTILPFTVASHGRIRLTVFNAKGKKVKTLVDAFKPSGCHTAVWDGTDANGMKVGTGVYLAELVAPAIRQIRRMVFIR